MRPLMRLLISWVVVMYLMVGSEAGGMEVRWCVAIRPPLLVCLIPLLDRPSPTRDVHHALERAYCRTGRIALVGTWTRYWTHSNTARRRMIVLGMAVPRWCSLKLLDARYMMELWVRECTCVLGVA